jgi:hypothetical protein
MHPQINEFVFPLPSKKSRIFISGFWQNRMHKNVQKPFAIFQEIDHPATSSLNAAFLQKEMQPAYGISKISVRSNNLSTTIIFFPTTKAAQPALR